MCLRPIVGKGHTVRATDGTSVRDGKVLQLFLCVHFGKLSAGFVPFVFKRIS